MTLSVDKVTTATYNLDVLEEEKQLEYQNYFYICATATSPRSNEYSDVKYIDLVLDCEHKYVTFRKKEAGKWSQLWQMTSSGMLEPIKRRSSRQGFILGIEEDTAYQPWQPLTVALKTKAYIRKSAKQTWRFMDGMLCYSTGNFCVHAVNDNDGLQDGAIAILGPGPQEGFPVPARMQMSCQKLYPGSGCLTVCIKMVGPVRVLQINDVKQRHLGKMVSKDDDEWEIYEESLNDKTNEKRKKPKQKFIELDVNMKKGVGISLINKVPEELLYITLENITLSYRSNHRGTTLEMNVSNIQADNQLFGASHTVMLFVTPTSKRDVVENTQALVISAHKLPNFGWNAEIFKHLTISMKKITVQLDIELLLKLVQFAGIGQSDTSLEKLEEEVDDLQKTLSSVTSVKPNRYYFGTLHVSQTCITLIMRIHLSVDADLEFAHFNESHTFESKEFFINKLTNHYKDGVTRQYIKILGCSLAQGTFHGIFNSTAEGFGKGLYQGVTGIVTKPLAGVLDFLSGMTYAIRDASRRSSHMQPSRVRNPRCRHGPGGLLPPYSLSQAESQALLYKLNEYCYKEVFLATELVRGGETDTLFVMITSHQVFFLRVLDHHKENIILNIKHGDYTQCRNFEREGRFYVEIFRKDVKRTVRDSSNKESQISCQTKSTAQKVAQQINYAKNLFDEKKLSLSVIHDDDEQY